MSLEKSSHQARYWFLEKREEERSKNSSRPRRRREHCIVPPCHRQAQKNTLDALALFSPFNSFPNSIQPTVRSPTSTQVPARSVCNVPTMARTKTLYAIFFYLFSPSLFKMSSLGSFEEPTSHFEKVGPAVSATCIASGPDAPSAPFRAAEPPAVRLTGHAVGILTFLNEERFIKMECDGFVKLLLCCLSEILTIIDRWRRANVPTFVRSSRFSYRFGYFLK